MCSTPLARPVGECKCTCESADQLSVNGWAEASLNPVHLFWNICSFTLKIRKSLDYLFGIKNEQTNKKTKMKTKQVSEEGVQWCMQLCSSTIFKNTVQYVSEEGRFKCPPFGCPRVKMSWCKASCFQFPKMLWWVEKKKVLKPNS